MSEDVRDRKLPGGSLLSAYLDRQLMIWSDRGGASMHIGDRWAAHCSEWLHGALNQPWSLATGEAIVISEIIRLDDVEAVSREANLNHLENPDFLLVGATHEKPGTGVILAVDAKFAVDRIKPSQVSAQIVENLISVPQTGVTRDLVQAVLNQRGYLNSRIVDGAFLCPDSTLTDFLSRRRSRGRNSGESNAAIVRIGTDPERMFKDLPASRLISILARLDALPVTPRENLLSALYYFRVASACTYLWQEQHAPLFTLEAQEPPEFGLVAADVATRAASSESAYTTMLGMVDAAEAVQKARQSVANVAALPLRMPEIRALLQSAGLEEEKQALRTLRRDLELEFRKRLFEKTGTIPSSDQRPIGQILDQVAAESRELRGHMQAYARVRVGELSPALTTS